MKITSIKNNINFKAKIENQQEVDKQLERLKQKNYHPVVFSPEYDEKINTLKNNELLHYQITAEIKKNNLCNKLYKLLNEKIEEIKTYGNPNDTIYIGSRTDNVSFLSYTNPKADNNVVSPSNIYYPTSKKVIENSPNNLINSILSLSKETFETVKNKHHRKIQKFEEQHGDIHNYTTNYIDNNEF